MTPSNCINYDALLLDISPKHNQKQTNSLMNDDRLSSLNCTIITSNLHFKWLMGLHDCQIMNCDYPSKRYPSFLTCFFLFGLGKTLAVFFFLPG